MELSQQAFGSPALMEQLARMDANLQALRPGEDWGGSEQFEGGEGLGLGDGTGVLQDLARARRPRRPARPSPTTARASTTSTSTRSPGSSATARRSTPGRCRSSSARCATAATSTAAPTASTGSARRRCGSSARRCCATWPSGCRDGRGSASSARRAPRATCRARPASGSSATPSRGTSRAASATRYDGPSPRVATRARAYGWRSGTSRCRRPRRAPRPPWRCWSTRRSRWRWTAAGCR